jgi:hypothetical protein
MSFRIRANSEELNMLTKNLQNQIDNIPISIDHNNIELTVNDRPMKAFAIASQIAADKFLYNNNQTNKFDLRTYESNGILYYPWVFSKTLKHDANGLAKKEDIDRLINVSTQQGSKQSIEELALSLDPNKLKKLEGVATGNSFWMHGCDTQLLDTSDRYITCDNIVHVCEMIEVYEKALLRDTSFIDIQNTIGTPVTRAILTMNNYLTQDGYKGPVNKSTGIVTGKELFRGVAIDVTKGPYISQLLIRPVYYNGIVIEQKYPVENDVSNTTDYTNFLSMQRGMITGPPNFNGLSKYIYSGRMLAGVVHNDPMYWAYYNASILMFFHNLDLEYSGSDVTTAWTDQGRADGLSAIAEVSLGALRVAWNSKYNIGLKIRPEVMAHRIDQIVNNVLTGGEFDTIKNHLVHGQDTLAAVLAANSNYLLNMTYPEGSPTHPSYPAGHAVLAGACVTVMKAYFKTHDASNNPLLWPMQTQHSLDGLSRVDYNETDANQITISGEINKLGCNMSIGRNIAGVHYRADGDHGMDLGEQFAIKFLQSKLKEYISTYNGMITDFKLEKLNGDYIRITLSDIYIVKSRS